MMVSVHGQRGPAAADTELTRQAMMGELSVDNGGDQAEQPLEDPCTHELREIKRQLHLALGGHDGSWVGLPTSEAALRLLFDHEAVLACSGRSRSEVFERSHDFWKEMFERRGGIPLDQAAGGAEQIGINLTSCCDKIAAVAYGRLRT